jgi:phage terminase large subunit-like protein
MFCTDQTILPKYDNVVYMPSQGSNKPVDGKKIVDLTQYLKDPQSGKQALFYHCEADIIFYGGAAGSGKSYGLLDKAAKPLNVSGYVAKIFRETSTEITSKGGLKDKSDKLYAHIPGARYNQSSMVWSFPTGSSVSFAHADTLDKKQLGAEIAFVGIDEITSWKEDDFWFLVSRNRTDCGVKAQLCATCNPDPDSFVAGLIDWWIDPVSGLPIEFRCGVIRYFYRSNDKLIWADTKEELLIKYPEIEQQAAIAEVNPLDLIKSFTFISATVYDNPIFIKENPSYIGTLLILDEVKKNRLLYGNWKISYIEGLLFNRNWIEVIEPEAVPNRGVTIRFWDFAATDAARATAQHYFTASSKIKFVPTSHDQFDMYILHSYWEQVEATEDIDDESIVTWANIDGKGVNVGWEVEGGSAGKKLAKYLQTSLKGFSCYPMSPMGNKLVRAQPVSQIAKRRKVHIVKGEWNKTYLDSLEKFTGKPVPLVADIMDSTSGAYACFVEHLMTLPSKPRVAKPDIQHISY